MQNKTVTSESYVCPFLLGFIVCCGLYLAVMVLIVEPYQDAHKITLEASK